MFYCQKVCGDEKFSIDEWNKALKYCEDMGIEGEERNKILNPELFPCIEQCFDCMAVVGTRRQKTRELLENQKAS